jgi:hypothetical protein
MINPAEHVYDDDPARGHPDVRTRLAGASYFFLSNGLIQAAVQWAPRAEGTLLGLLVMDPERLRAKRDALTFDAERGLAPTVMHVTAAGRDHQPQQDQLQVAWASRAGVPAVEAVWGWRGGEVRESFFCPDHGTPTLAREVGVSGSHESSPIQLRTGVGGRVLEVALEPPARRACFIYTLDPAGGTVGLRTEPAADVAPDARRRWADRPELNFGHDVLDRFWHASRYQLAGAISATGRMDASIWQYGREWVRDQAFVAVGCLMAGDRHAASCILDRLLRDFVTDEGGTVDSSEVRGRDEAELDQNGALLYALEQYVHWTGDLSLVNGRWTRISAVADYPLRPEFIHPASGLLFNSREFWERHRLHGILPGFELVHQALVSIGLDAAASLARRTGRGAPAERWAMAAERLRAGTLGHPTCALVSDGALVKRKNLDGTVQDAISPEPGSLAPTSAPLFQRGPHRLNPDTCTALTVAMGFIPAESALARRTLDSLEPLWSQAWDDGGYGRYHVSSEPDSPGGWPFASLFVARAAIDAGLPDRAWRVLHWLDRVAGAPAGSWFEFYGRRESPPCPQVGVIPWTWSEMLALLVGHVLGVRPQTGALRIRPRLLPGLDHLAGHFRYGDGWVEFRVASDPHWGAPLARLRIDGGRLAETVADQVVIPAGAGEAIVEFVLPPR